MSIKNKKKGFTLIELLVVIAIIGILSSVVLASLSTARQKSRDAKRVSDIGQVQLALELYFDGNQTYPSTTPATFTGADAAIKAVQAKGFLPQVPTPPAGSAATYLYRGIAADGTECTAVGTACTSYALGVDVERTDNVVLASDADQTLGTVFYGGSGTVCTASGAGVDKCYDVKP